MVSNPLRSNAIYALGNAANSAALLLLIPFLVRALSSAEYGAWSLFEITILLLIMVMGAGFDIGLMREYWLQPDEAERRRLAGSVLSLAVLWNIAAALGFWAIGTALRNSCAPGGLCDLLRPDWLLTVVLIGPSEALFNLLIAIFRIRERAAVFAALSFSRLVIFLGLAVAGVQLGGGLGGALLGRLGATLIVLVAALVLVRSYVSPAFSWPIARRVLRYGLPLLPANLAAYILIASDRYVLQSVSTLEVVAIYSFAYKMATALEVLITRPFAIDWAPRRFKIATQPDPQAKYAEAMVIYLFAAAAGALLIAAGVPLAYAWIAPATYAAGQAQVAVILAAQVAYGISYPLNVGIMLKDRTGYVPLITWAAAAICLGLNAWWIPTYGMAGAAWATLVAYLIYSALIAAVSQWLYPVLYDLPRIGLVCGAILAGALGLTLIDTAHLAIPLLATTALRALWVVLVFAAAAYSLWVRGQNLPPLLRRRDAHAARGSD